MKKHLSKICLALLWIVMLFLFLFAACGKEEPAPEAASSAPAAQTGCGFSLGAVRIGDTYDDAGSGVKYCGVRRRRLLLRFPRRRRQKNRRRSPQRQELLRQLRRLSVHRHRRRRPRPHRTVWISQIKAILSASATAPGSIPLLQKAEAAAVFTTLQKFWPGMPNGGR